MPAFRKLIAAFAGCFIAAAAVAQWDPANAQWGKSDSGDLRVMTWNLHDTICSTNSKVEGYNNWCAAAHVVAAFRPDFLLIQEAGDNEGNGTGSGVDSVTVLAATVEEFMYGGAGVTAYVQKYAPDFDLPYVFVSGRTDGYNRNVILSRYPFVDLNGDGKDVNHDIPSVSSSSGSYAPGGNGQIRGFQFAEIDLPAAYAGDLVLGGAHLKCCSNGAAERLTAAQNVAYVVDYWFNGAGQGVPDPFNKIFDIPAATRVLDGNTPIVLGGDWNEDELRNGRRGPAAWLTEAQFTGSSDGTDRDRSDMIFDSATHFFTGDGATYASSKLDYLAWQDSIVSLRRAFIYNGIGTPAAARPPEVASFADPQNISGWASDHLPVIADLIFPAGDPCTGTLPADSNCDGSVDNEDIDPFVLAVTQGQAAWEARYTCGFLCVNDVNGDGAVDNEDIDPFVGLLMGL